MGTVVGGVLGFFVRCGDGSECGCVYYTCARHSPAGTGLGGCPGTPRSAFLHLPVKSLAILADCDLAENGFQKQWRKSLVAPEHVQSAVWLTSLA